MKKITLFFIALFLGFSLVGCNDPKEPVENPDNGDDVNGGDDNGGNTNGGNDAEEKVVLTSISVNSSNLKLKYLVGEEFSETGLSVTGHYSDGSTKDLSAYILVDSSKFDSSIAGTYTISVSYLGSDGTKTIDFDVTVEEAPEEVTLKGLQLNLEAVKVEYLVGEEFDASGIVAIASYSDDSIKDVSSEIEIDSVDFDSSKEGTYVIRVKYVEVVDEVTSSYTVKVEEETVAIEIVDFATAASAVKQGDKLVNAGEATIHYIRQAYQTTPEVYKFYIGNNYIRVEDDLEMVNRVSHFTTYLDLNNNLQLYGVGFNGQASMDPLHTVKGVEGWTTSPFSTSGFKNEKGEVVPCNYIGAGGLVKGLYDLAISDRGYNVTTTVPSNANGKYTLVFDALLDDVSFGLSQQFLYHVVLSFTVNENQVCDSLTLSTYFLEQPGFTVNNDGTVTIAADAVKYQTVNYTISQTEGARTETSPYHPSFKQDEELVIVGGVRKGSEIIEPMEFHDGDVLVLTVGKYYKFYADGVEATAKVVYDKNCGAWGDGAIDVSSFGGEIWLNCFNVSEFTHKIVFTYDYLETTIYVRTMYLPITTLKVGGYVGTDGYFPSYINLEEGRTVQVNSDFYIYPDVNTGALRDFNVELLEESGATIAPATIPNCGLEGYLFNATVCGTYNIRVTCNENPEFTKVVTITVEESVEEPADYSGLIAAGKKYSVNSDGYNLKFSFTTEGAGKEPYFTMTGTGPDGESYDHSYYVSFDKYNNKFSISQDYPMVPLNVELNASGDEANPTFTITFNGVTLTLVAE